MQILHDRAIINVEFNVAPFSTSERKKRSKNDKYSICSAFIHRTHMPSPALTDYASSHL